jgi:hypothetical protein
LFEIRGVEEILGLEKGGIDFRGLPPLAVSDQNIAFGLLRSPKAVSISLKAESASLRSLLRSLLTLPTSIGVLAKSS